MKPTALSLRSLVALACVSIGLAHHAMAANVFIHEDNANVVPVVGVTGFATEGDDMAGMRVTVFSNVSPGGDSAIWNAVGVGAGAAIGPTGWTLREAGDTFLPSGGAGLWSFAVNEPDMIVNRILIEGFEVGADVEKEGTIFDRQDPVLGTQGSYRGRDFLVDSMTGVWDLDVTYRDPIQVDGLGLIGETFRAVDLRFIPTRLQQGGVFRPNDSLLFRMDSDTVGLFTGDCLDRDECMPEPGSGTLLGMCGLALPLLRRRRQRCG